MHLPKTSLSSPLFVFCFFDVGTALTAIPPTHTRERQGRRISVLHRIRIFFHHSTITKNWAKNRSKESCLPQANAGKWIWWSCNNITLLILCLYLTLIMRVRAPMIMGFCCLFLLRMMTDYKVEMINDGVQEFHVEFHGPKESNDFYKPSSFFFST